MHHQLLAEYRWLWFKIFPSPKLLAVQSLKNPICPIVLPQAEEERDEFILFLSALVPSETQNASSRIWIRVDDSIVDDNNG